MVFSSLLFLCFLLPFTIILYYVIPKKFKNIFLLFVSLIFYSWSGLKYTFLLLTVVIFNYLIGILIGHVKKRKVPLLIGIIGNLAILFYFKYTNFFVGNINLFFKTSIFIEEIILPIGISFYIFQSISYIVDVYRQYKNSDENSGKNFYQKNFINMALYITFFPQLIAGPIVRYHDISNQLIKRECKVDKISQGLSRFIVGLSKKVLIADYVGKIADDIFYLDINNLSTGVAWIGIICYSLQILFDFSGYSDMAIGLGKIFGFEFLENFNFPYISKSITEFWRRWHMSLSGWFRDYVYIPLGGNRKGNVYFNLGVVFILTGIWHGAHWNYILWGIWHGFFILAERFINKNEKLCFNIPGIFKWIYTMLVVLIGWVFFRADSIGIAIQYIMVMFRLKVPEFVIYDPLFYLSSRNIFIIIIGFVAAFIPIKKFIQNKLKESTYQYMISIFTILLLVINFIFIVNSTYSPFIYFQF